MLYAMWASLATGLAALAHLLCVRGLHVEPSLRPTLAFVPLILALSCLAGGALLHLVPVPTTLWSMLPGRSGYAPVVDVLTAENTWSGTMALSFAPALTARALGLIGCCLSLVLAVHIFDRLQRRALVFALLAIALFQVLLGIAQIATGGASVFTTDFAGHVRASGTFVNKNHFASLLAMLLPVALFGLLATAARVRRSASDRKPLLLAAWAVVSILLAAGIIMSMSRAALAATLIVIGMVATLHAASRKRRRSHRTRVLAFGGIFAIAVVVLLMSSDMLVRAVTDPAALDSLAARGLMTAASWEAAKSFFPLGTGPASFALVFPAFQPAELRGFVEHAHNEYVQLLVEFGLLGACFLLAAMWAAVLLMHRAWLLVDDLGLGHAALLGAIAFALHAWLDFPARIPALAFTFTVLVTVAATELAAKPGRRPSPSAPGSDVPSQASADAATRSDDALHSGESMSMNWHSTPN